MKYFKLFFLFSIGVYSCSKPSCDCDLLFKDKDSLVSISASNNPEVKQLISRKYDLNNEYVKIVLQAKKEDESDIGDPYEDQLATEKTILKLKEIEKQKIKNEMELLRITRYSSNRKEEQKIIPYTGYCFRKGEDQEIYYQAEYENGKLISEEWIK